MKSIFSMLKSAVNGADNAAGGPKTSPSKSSADQKSNDQRAENNVEDLNASDVAADGAAISGTAATLAALTGLLGIGAKSSGAEEGTAGSSENPEPSQASQTPPSQINSEAPLLQEQEAVNETAALRAEGSGVAANNALPEITGDILGNGAPTTVNAPEDAPELRTDDSGAVAPVAPTDAEPAPAPTASVAPAPTPRPNDAAPVDQDQTPVVPNPPSMASVDSGGAVAENAVNGTVVATLDATADAGEALSFAITDSAGNPVTDSNFEIVGDQIQVKTGADINFEGATSHDIYVTTSNGSGTSDPQQITLTVNDVAENIVLGDGGVAFTDLGVSETSITGGTGDDTITAHVDGGMLNGGIGDDQLLGLAGDDILTGGSGDDTINGGLGNDTIIGDSSHNYVVNGSFEDVSTGNAGPNGFFATSIEGWTDANGALIEMHDSGYSDVDATHGNYWLDTTENNGSHVDISQTIEGLGANETYRLSFDAAQQNNCLPASMEVYFGGQFITTIDPSTYDTMQTFDFEIIGGSGDGSDILRFDADSAWGNVGLSLDNVQIVAAGDDVLDGGAGDDTLSGGAGDDTLTGGEGDDQIDGGSGIDRAEFGGPLSEYTVTYDATTETFTVTDNNTANGDDGTDTVTGVENFTFDGVSYTASEMQTEAARQANTAPSDIAFASGGTVNETVADGGTIGSAYDPSGATVATLTTTDVDGGDSHTYSIVSDASGKFEIVGDEVRVKSGQTIDYETDTSFDLTVRSTDQFGGTHDEVLTLNVADFEGSASAVAGDEVITGTSEEDTISWARGDGSDTIEGGDGNDTLIVDASVTDMAFRRSSKLSFDDVDGSGVVVDVSGVETIQFNDATFDMSSWVQGTTGDDTFIGTATSDLVTGSQGHDNLDGGGGNDYLFGNSGDDTLVGGAGNDYLHGGTESDTLKGGAGDDFLDGDEHTDTVVYDGDLTDYIVTYDSGTSLYTVTDTNLANGDDGTDTIRNVENFRFNGTEYTEAQIQAYVDGSAPTAIILASGGTINETVSDGGSIAAAYDPSGTTVATLATTDASSGDTHSYSLVNDVSGKFEIVGDEIRVKSGQVVDYETNTSFDLTIRTTDLNGQTHDEVLTLNVADFSGSYTAVNSGETITGTSEADTITGSNGSDVINAGDGDDVIYDGSGPDTIDGGEGSDTIHLEDSDYGYSNTIVDTGTSGIDTILLNQGDHTYRVQGNFSAASSGIEVIDGTAESGEVLGTQDASANFDFTDITLKGVDGIEGTNTADTITGSGGDDTIRGLDGDDTLRGGAGDDTLDGGAGTDRALYAGDRSNYDISYDAGSSTFTIRDIDATDGADDGTDLVKNVESFVFNGVSYTASDLIAGPGDLSEDNPDTANYDDGSGPIAATYTGTSGDDVFLGTGIEDVAYGGAGNDDLNGNSGNDTLYGGSDNDTLTGMSGEDRLYGGAGDDQLDGDSGNDVLYGDGGNDTLDGGSDEDQLYGGSGDDTLHGGSSNDILHGDADDDTLYGDGGQDTLYGGTGIDTLHGGDETDTLYGNEGADTLYGDAGDDNLYGGAGNDALTGGAGNDIMDGGTGDDSFLISAMQGNDIVSGGAGWTDTIELQGVSGAISVSGDTVTGNGWTMVLDAGHTVDGQAADSVTLSSDSAGVITFDNGGTVDFSGVENVSW